MMKRNILILITVWLIYAGCGGTTPPMEFLPEDSPLALVLTWQRDPATTMTIDWHSHKEFPMDTVWYRQSGEIEWISGASTTHPFPFSTRKIHRVELTGLIPESEYEFKFNENSRIYSFRTMPDRVERPVRFAAGGDVMHRKEWMKKTNRQAARYDPDFIIWGGDLAYADGAERKLRRWYDFLAAMSKTLILPDGRVIPVVVAIGNHEVRRGYYHRHADASEDDEFRESIAPYFYNLFAFPGQPGYNVLDFGDYMSLIALDSGHTNPIDGIQTEWLNRILTEREDIPYIFPFYHIPAYPGTGSFGDKLSVQIRKNWSPLFEEHGLRVVFENHDHLYKRTHPMKNEEVDPAGVVYLGDGAWGVRTRHPRGWLRLRRTAPYLKETASERHFIVVTVSETHQHFHTVSSRGEIVDQFTVATVK